MLTKRRKLQYNVPLNDVNKRIPEENDELKPHTQGSQTPLVTFNPISTTTHPIENGASEPEVCYGSVCLNLHYMHNY